MLGADVMGPEQRDFNGLRVDLWPRLSWSPRWALTFADIQVHGAGVQQLLLRAGCGPGRTMAIRALSACRSSQSSLQHCTLLQAGSADAHADVLLSCR